MFVFKPESFDAQTNRAVFQWSSSVFRVCHHLSALDWIGNIILTLKIFSSLLSSLRAVLSWTQSHCVSETCHYFHLCLRVHSSSELKNSLFAHRVKISIPLKVHVCLRKTQCHFQKVCVIHWGYYVHSILPPISLSGRNIMLFFWSGLVVVTQDSPRKQLPTLIYTAWSEILEMLSKLWTCVDRDLRLSVLVLALILSFGVSSPPEQWQMNAALNSSRNLPARKQDLI